jgi:TPR repeat protein
VVIPANWSNGEAPRDADANSQPSQCNLVVASLWVGVVARFDLEKPDQPDEYIVHNPVRGVQQFVARKLRTAQTIAAKEADPVELWNAVKRGSVKAEVALANLYLEGEAVPQNCEQAQMLLYAASMKGSKLAGDFLKSSYPQRCERLAPSF